MQTIANKVQLIGRLGSDPEVKVFETGKMLRVSLATDASYRDREGKKVQDTHWHTIVAWNKVAELGEQMFRKGQQVAVEGSLINRTYEDNEGTRKFITEVKLDKFLMLSKKNDES